VPAGIWAADEYARLCDYDNDTAQQPPGLFLCHQTDADWPTARLCAGWVGCHGDQLLGLRLAAATGTLDDAALDDAMSYISPIPLFATGAQAAGHGISGIADPDPAARAMIDKIIRRRDL